MLAATGRGAPGKETDVTDEITNGAATEGGFEGQSGQPAPEGGAPREMLPVDAPPMDAPPIGAPPIDGVEQRIEESKNWFERAAEHIPGYKGYKQKELRREADKLQRDYVVERLETARRGLESVALEMTDRGDLQLLSGIDRIGRKLRTVKDRYLYADYGYAGIFDTVKVGDEVLDLLYRFDVQSQEYARHLEELVGTLSADSPSVRSDLEILDERVTALDLSFNEREHLITGVGR